MRDRWVGWAFVAAQAVLLGALVVVPGGDLWPTPGWLDVIGWTLVGAGLLVVVLAGHGLGAALTPTPTPRRGAPLATDGWYRIVRHPIYSGVLLAVTGLVVRSAGIAAVVVGAVTWAFFHVKARWEEERLRAAHPEYDDYAAVTPRFVPRPQR